MSNRNVFADTQPGKFNPQLVTPEARVQIQQSWQKQPVSREELGKVLKLIQNDLNDLHRALNVQGILIHLLMEKTGVKKEEIAEFTKRFNETLLKEAESTPQEPEPEEKPATSLIVEG